MTTALQIITTALGSFGAIGPADTVEAEDAELGLSILNGIVDGWANQPHAAYAVSEAVVNLTPDAFALTIGPGQAIDTPRPAKIEEGSFARVDGIDREVPVLSFQQYNAIALKDTSATWPMGLYYEAGASAGTVYIWPRSQGNCALHLMVGQFLSAFADVSTDYTLAPGTRKALEFELACDMAPHYGREVPASVMRRGMAARRIYKRAHVVVPTLDSGMGRPADWWIPQQ